MHRLTAPAASRLPGISPVLVALMAIALMASAPVRAAAPAAPVAAQLPAAPVPSLAGIIAPGDTLMVQVFGQPDMNGPVIVADDGTIAIPLVGTVPVGSLSPVDAAHRVEDALRKANLLVDPHVSITVNQSRNLRISVLGEVANPGRYPIEAGTSALDLLAQAGGVRETGNDTALLIRKQADGTVRRIPLNIRQLSKGGLPEEVPAVVAGDVLLVPPADEYYVTGEVTTPARYRYRQGMTVSEAVANAGGVTPRGSDSRIDIRRKLPDGRIKTLHASQGDPVQPDDIIQVKERLF